VSDVGVVEGLAVYPVKSLAGRSTREVRVDPAGIRGDRAWTVVEVLGRPVRLARTDRPQVDAAAVHLVSRAAVLRAAGGDVPEGCSADDPRANVVLDLHDGEDERAWVGRTLRVGEVELAVTRTPKHCLGVYAEVRTPGRIRTGDSVQLLG
jgi:uncharacterized protein YcbX